MQAVEGILDSTMPYNQGRVEVRSYSTHREDVSALEGIGSNQRWIQVAPESRRLLCKY